MSVSPKEERPANREETEEEARRRDIAEKKRRGALKEPRSEPETGRSVRHKA